VFVIQPVRNRSQPRVEGVLSGLVAADQQDHSPAEIEGIKYLQQTAANPHPQLAHVTMAGAIDAAEVRKR